MAQSNQELVVQIKADLSKLQKGLAGAEQKANGFKQRMQKIGASLKTAFAFSGVLAVGALFANATKTVVKFDASVANLAAVTGKTREQIKALNYEAQRLGSTTKFTATEVTELQTELAKLGFREKDIKDLAPPILDLAAATGKDLAGAAALAGSVVQSFGLQASDTQNVVDIMAKSFTASALDIQKFEVGIRQVAPVAKNANVELSEVTAMLGVLANNGVRAESAGVGLRNVLLEAAKRGVPFEELLRQVNESSDKAATAMGLFGKENAAVGVILAENANKANKLNDALKESAGTAKEMADKQLDTLSGKLTLLASAWDGFVLSIEKGDGVLAKFVRGFIEEVTELLNLMSGVEAKINGNNVTKRADPAAGFNEYLKNKNRKKEKEAKSNIDAINESLEKQSEKVEETAEKFNDYNAVLLDTTKEVNKLGGALQKIGGDFGFEDRLIEQQISQMQQIQTVAGGIESAFNSMANSLIDSLGLAETGFQGFVKVLLQTVAQIISAIVAQSIATAIVNAMQSSQATGPAALFAQPAFIATALAGVGAALATIPAFASGGIVNGSSFSGDRVMARVNSGEMILNRSQQANLFGMINRGGGGNERLVTQIAGNDLRVVLERAQKTNNRLR